MVNASQAAQSQPVLRGLFYWRVIAWWLLILVTTLTLIPNPTSEGLGFDVNDKLAHLVCYAALAFCFGCLRLGQQLLVPMVLLMLLGMALECVQLLSMYGRMFEWFDMLANGAGVLLGAVLSLSPLGKLFFWLEQMLGWQE